MKNIDMAWVRSQLENAKVSVPVGESVLALIDIWAKTEHIDSDDEKVLELFFKLCRTTALVDTLENEVWQPAGPGFIRVGDEVRVLADAFEGELGQLHNGRRGRVVAVRYGDIIVKTTDGKEPVLDGSHYSPYKLEKLVSAL
jgi:hypothetical protein